MNHLTKKIDNCGSAERKSGSGRPRSLKTADNVSMIQDMICSQDDAPCSHINPRKLQEHIEHCNLAWILFIKRITATFVVADGPLTSINQTCASILAVVYVLLAVLRKRIKWPWKRISKYYENAWNKVYKNARKKSTKTHGQSLRKRIDL